MGVTLSGPHKSIDMGGGGYANLRITIAKQLNCPEFSELYEDLLGCGHIRYAEKGFRSMSEYFDDHDKKVLEICEKHNMLWVLEGKTLLVDMPFRSVRFAQNKR